MTYQCGTSLFSLLGGNRLSPMRGQCQPLWCPILELPPPLQPPFPPLRPSCVMHAENLAWSAMLRPEGEHSGEVEAGQAREPCVRCSGAAARGLGPVKALSPFLPPPHCPLTLPPLPSLLFFSPTSPSRLHPLYPLFCFFPRPPASVPCIRHLLCSGPLCIPPRLSRSLSAPPCPSLPLSPSEAQLAPGLRQGSRRAHAARAWEGQPESPLRAVVSGPRGPRGGRDGQASAPAEEEEAIAVLGQRAPPQGAPACKARAASGLVALAQWGTLQQRLRWRRPGTRARAGLRARSRRTRKTVSRPPACTAQERPFTNHPQNSDLIGHPTYSPSLIAAAGAPPLNIPHAAPSLHFQWSLPLLLITPHGIPNLSLWRPISSGVASWISTATTYVSPAPLSLL